MASYYPSDDPWIAELALTLQRLRGVLPKRQLHQVATTIVGRFYRLTQMRDTAYWSADYGPKVYLAVRLDGQSRVWLPPAKGPDLSMIVATVDKNGILDEVYKGSTSALLGALEESGNRTITLKRLVERLLQLGLLEASQISQLDGGQTADVGRLAHYPEDFPSWSTPLSEIQNELQEIEGDQRHPIGAENEDGGAPPPDDPPPPDGDGPGRGTGGLQELLNHAVLLSADKNFFDELFDIL